GSAFEFFRNKSLNAKSPFERFNNQSKAPFKQNQYGLTLGGPFKRDQTFYFASAEILHTDTANFVTISPAAAALLNANGFPVDLGNVPYSVKSKAFLTKVDHQWKPTSGLTVRANYASILNENIEPFGGIVARSRGAVQDRKDWAAAGSETDVLSERWINELRG